MELFREEYKPRIDQAMDILLGFSATAAVRAVQQNADSQASIGAAWILVISCMAVSLVLAAIVIAAMPCFSGFIANSAPIRYLNFRTIG